jgi:hypothetical protein
LFCDRIREKTWAFFDHECARTLEHSAGSLEQLGTGKAKYRPAQSNHEHHHAFQARTANRAELVNGAALRAPSSPVLKIDSRLWWGGCLFCGRIREKTWTFFDHEWAPSSPVAARRFACSLLCKVPLAWFRCLRSRFHLVLGAGTVGRPLSRWLRLSAMWARRLRAGQISPGPNCTRLATANLISDLDSSP